MPPPLPLNLASFPALHTRKALLILDVQNEFCSDAAALPVVDPEGYLDRIKDLASTFHSTGFGDVFWIRSQFESHRPVAGTRIIVNDAILPPPSTRPSGRNRRRLVPEPIDGEENVDNGDDEAFLSIGDLEPDEQRKKVERLLPGSINSELVNSILPAIDTQKDMIVAKTHYSAFQSTQLLTRLRTHLVTELYLCGVLTNVSIHATALDAARYGIALTLIEDCCGYRSANRHNMAIQSLVQLTGCDIVDSADLLDAVACESKPPGKHKSSHSSHSKKAKDASAAAVSSSSSALTSPAGKSGTLPVRTKAPRPDAGSLESPRRVEADAESPPLQVSQLKPAPLTAAAPQEEPQAPASVLPMGPVAQVTLAESSKTPKSHEMTKTLEAEKATKPEEEAQTKEPLKKPEMKEPLKEYEAKEPLEPKETLKGSKAKDTPETKETKTPEETKEPLETKETLEPESKEPEPKEPESKEPESKETESEKPEPKATPAESEEPKAAPMAATEPLCEGDTLVYYNLLPPSLEEGIYDQLCDEVHWQHMSHHGGEVPRLISVQGELDDDGNMPVYRHPTDESPPLESFSPTVLKIRAEVEKAVGHPVNHVLIQLYRTGHDYISEHSDKTLDIAAGSYVCNVSLGAERMMIFRTKRVKKEEGAVEGHKRETCRVQLPHNSLCRLGLQTNMRWLHCIRQDKRMDRDKTEAELAYGGGRISLTFRQIGTFLNSDQTLIWGQGAVGKTRETAQAVANGQCEEAVRMLRAFGTENHSTEFVWEEHYGMGFNVLNMGDSARFFVSRDAVVNLSVQLQLAEVGLAYAKGSMGEAANAAEDTPTLDAAVRFIDSGSSSNAAVDGVLAILLYLDGVYGSARHAAAKPLETAQKYTRLQQALWLQDQWRAAKKAAAAATAEGRSVLSILAPDLAVWEKYAAEDAKFIAGSTASVADCAFWPVLHELAQTDGDEGFCVELQRLKLGQLAEYYTNFAAQDKVKHTCGKSDDETKQ